MNYQKIYDQLIQKRKNNKLSKKDCYCEEHHIIPLSEGGPDTKYNKINLSAREHYIAHLLLAKIYDDFKMYSAITYMQTGRHKNRQFKYNNRLYEKNREKFGRKQKGKIVSEETRRKISKANKGHIAWNKGITFMKGENHPFFGKHHTEDTKQKLRRPKTEIEKQHMRESFKNRDYNGEKNPMFGKDFQEYMSKEDIEKRKQNCRNARLGKINITDGVYRKMWDKNTPIPEGWIKWKMNESMRDKMRKVQKTKVIYQYTLDLKFIQSYESLSECSKKTKLNIANISSCCLGKHKSCGGFIFIYQEDICYFF